MSNSRALHMMATRPSMYAKFLQTGRMPQTIQARSPLIDILSKIGARDRLRMVGFTIDPSLGYQGRRQFHNAEQALRWLRPHETMVEGESWPAESWRIKAFANRLDIQALIAACASSPADLASRYSRL